MLNRYFVRNLKRTEMEAAYKFNFSNPKYLIMYNEDEKNKFGNSKGYRIVTDAMSKVLLPDEYRGFRSRAWTTYQVRDWSLFTGRGGLQNGRGRACEVLPLRKGGAEKVLAMLKGGHIKF